MSIKIIPTGAPLGIRIRGADLAQPFDGATSGKIERAYNEHDGARADWSIMPRRLPRSSCRSRSWPHR
jgi:hypothetical protein